MPNSLVEQLPGLLPLAVAWAAEQERVILGAGLALTPSQLEDARKVGVKFPGKIRLLAVAAIPVPEDSVLRAAAASARLLTPETIGLTLRYGIFIRDDQWENRDLIAHECVHTGQYERFGSIEAFLAEYLRQCLEIGYPAAPLEQEAITNQKRIHGAGPAAR